jgi:hypothetical protein
MVAGGPDVAVSSIIAAAKPLAAAWADQRAHHNEPARQTIP